MAIRFQRFCAALTVLVLSLTGCATYGEWDAQNAAAVNCFSPQSQNASCEPSGAVMISGDTVLIVSEDVPAAPSGQPQSNLFTVNLAQDGKPDLASHAYVTGHEIVDAAGDIKTEKFESVTVTPDKKLVIAATAFDRDVNNGSFKRLLSWRADDVSNPVTMNAISPAFHDRLLEALGTLPGGAGMFDCDADPATAAAAPDYAKLEGIAARAAGGKTYLYFGIRHMGCPYPAYKKGAPRHYLVALMRVPYEADLSDKISLKADEMKAVFYMSSKEASAKLGLSGERLGLSDMAYDARKNRFLILTSYEDDDCKGGSCKGFLWTLSGNYKNFKPVKDKQTRRALQWDGHKPEGIALMPNGSAFIVFDDDKLDQAKRDKEKDQVFKGSVLPNQSISGVLRISN